MAVFQPTKFFLYRWRYVIGYSLIGVLLAGLLLFAGLYVPGGISDAEMQSAILSENFSWSVPATWAVTSLPFHTLQAVVFDLFGVNEFTIKLPSLILALISALGLIVLLRRWFKPNIAVLASAIAVSTGQFLFIAQNGTPSVEYILWPVLLLLVGTQVTRGKRFRFLWKILFAVTAAFSLYTPLGIYTLIAIAAAIILHPHLRHILRSLSKLKLLTCLAIFAILIVPLSVSLVHDPQMGLTLLGIPASWPPDLITNLQTLFKQYLAFWQPSTTTLMTPVFGLGSTIIIAIGLYRLIRTRETTRSYLIITWIACLIPVLIINPAFTSVTFLPAVFLLAAGLTSLISYWYRLFPFNPYARIAGLIPLIALVVILIGSGIDRYIYGYHYDPSTSTNFSKDIRLIPVGTSNLVVSDEELPFYQVVAKHRDNLSVSTSPNSDTFVATRDAKAQVPRGYDIQKIITTTHYNEADRLYIYKKTAQ